MSAAITLDAIKARCTQDGECWIWTGATVHGRPCMAQRRDGKRVNAPVQRQALEIAGKTSPWGGRAQCRCGNALCCNPAHLVQVSQGKAWRFAGNPFAQLLQGGRA